MSFRVSKKLLSLVFLSIVLAGRSFATPGTKLATGLTQPKGAIMWNGSLFVADGVQGFCRIDGGVLTAPGDPATCTRSCKFSEAVKLHASACQLD